MPAPKDPVKRELWRKHLSESHIGIQAGEKHPQYGKHSWSKGKHFSEDHCKKIGDAQRGEKNHRFGKHNSPDHRLKVSLALTGCTRSIETRKKVSIANTKENHPNWKGGISFEPYCPKFNNEFKERVRAFFGYTCQLCGHVWQEGEVKLSVHHVNYNKKACCEQKIIPLFVPVCSGKCHLKTNYRRDYYETYFTELIMTKYDGQCYLPKEEPK